MHKGLCMWGFREAIVFNTCIELNVCSVVVTQLHKRSLPSVYPTFPYFCLTCLENKKSIRNFTGIWNKVMWVWTMLGSRICLWLMVWGCWEFLKNSILLWYCDTRYLWYETLRAWLLGAVEKRFKRYSGPLLKSITTMLNFSVNMQLTIFFF